MADLASIPGISATDVPILQSLGLFTSDDLLRSDRASLAAHAPGVSVERVAAWQAYAELIGLSGMTPAMASALLAAGAKGVSHLAGWTLARARTALPGVDDETVLACLKDAVVAGQTGVLNGHVRLADGSPVEGASVTVAGTPALSDPRGRFRVTRLALDREVTVVATHPRLGQVLQAGVPVHRSTALIGQFFVLPGSPQTPADLTELRGDALPPLGSSSITTRAVRDKPDPSDLLMVVDRHPGGDYRLASRFLDFTGGRFVRRTYRMGADQLPPTVRHGVTVRWDGAAWSVVEISARQIDREIRCRKVRSDYGRTAGSFDDLVAALRAVAQAMSDP